MRTLALLSLLLLSGCTVGHVGVTLSITEKPGSEVSLKYPYDYSGCKDSPRYYDNGDGCFSKTPPIQTPAGPL